MALLSRTALDYGTRGRATDHSQACGKNSGIR
jgi:hypothetical protein